MNKFKYIFLVDFDKSAIESNAALACLHLRCSYDRTKQNMTAANKKLHKAQK